MLYCKMIGRSAIFLIEDNYLGASDRLRRDLRARKREPPRIDFDFHIVHLVAEIFQP